VAVTFDDGYAETAALVRPILERLDIPATMFVPSGSLGQVGEFWWDDLERMLLSASQLPKTLNLDCDQKPLEFSLGGSALLTATQVAATRSWCAWQAPPTERHALYAALWRICHDCAADERRRIIDDVRLWSGTKLEARGTHGVLDSGELASLSSGGLIEIGGHTVNHPALSALTRAEQLLEIRDDKRTLEALTRRPVHSFAYPFGKAADYTAETVAIVREAGFLHACSNVRGPVAPGDDPYELPRVFVADWDARSFADRLTGVLAAQGAAAQ
jgi:peptidoglycan/xylan/chitin deacetylase (PgdA/CDA1 family)